MPHPHIKSFKQLTLLHGSAREQGYRMPAEWEPMRRIWLTFPHNAETWPGCLGKALKQFRAWMNAMKPFVEVMTTQKLGVKTNDSWIRDYGPIFVVKSSQQSGPKGTGFSKNQKSEIRDQKSRLATRSLDHSATSHLALHDFHFNGWGGKYEVRDLDDVIPQHIARRYNVPLFLHNMVLEGGSIEVNGVGTVMTTRQCLLNKNRNPKRTPESILREIHEALGTHHVIWLPGGIVGDDTDGHIDDLARFVSRDTIVAVRVRTKGRGHQDFDVLNRNWKALKGARDQDGRKLTIVELPAPDPILYNFPPDRFGPGGVNPVPASHANFLIANGAVFVPVFGQRSDDIALRTLEQVMPNYKIVPVRAEFLVVGLGSLHCLSQQEPEEPL